MVPIALWPSGVPGVHKTRSRSFLRPVLKSRISWLIPKPDEPPLEVTSSNRQVEMRSNRIPQQAIFE